VPLHSDASNTCSVRFTAATLRVPGDGDRRALGAHYYSFDFARR
jgi:hypothetical protein